MLTVAARTFFIYIFITLFMRLSGKRQVGQMQIGELVSALLLSEVASLPITDPNVPLIVSVLPVLLLTLFEIVSSCLCARFPKIKKLAEGTPSLLVDGGRLDAAQLFRARLSPDELLAQLRLKGIADLSEVDYAILEQNGQISVIQKAGKRPATPEDHGLSPVNTGLALPLIVCGCPNTSNLTKLGVKKEDLEKKIAPRRIKDVLLCTMNDAGELCLIPKND